MDDNALGNLHSLLHLNMAHNRFVALPSDLFHEAKYLQVFTTSSILINPIWYKLFNTFDIGIDIFLSVRRKKLTKKSEQYVI